MKTGERKITLTYREGAAGKKATLVVDVSAEEDDLPHEHRDDLRETAAELLGVPLSALPEGVEVELRRKGHSHPHPTAVELPPSSTSEREKQKA